MFPSLLLAAVFVGGLLAFLGGGDSDATRAPGDPGTTDDEGTDALVIGPGTAQEVVLAIQEELVAQSAPRGRQRLRRLLEDRLTLSIDASVWQMGFPCDVRGLPTFDRLSMLCTTIGEAYGVPVVVQRTELGGIPFAAITVGPWSGSIDPSASEGRYPVPGEPDLSWIEREAMGDAFGKGGGGILGLIMNTVIASVVGTVTSMATQSVVHSMGGEPRLARMMRHYRQAEERGDEAAMERIRGQVTRTASRIKGRKVDWKEVEAVVGGR